MMQDSTTALPDVDRTKIPQKKRRWRLLVLIALVFLLLVGIFGFVLYQNNVNQTHAHNAYLATLSAGGTLAFSDPLREASGSQWTTSSNIGTCQFDGGAYRVQTQGNYLMVCPANGTYRNFAFEVQLTMYQTGCGGISFRDDGQGQFYYFSICASGRYDMLRYAHDGTDQELSYGPSSAIHNGQGKPNTIAVRAVGSVLTFSVNEQPLSQVQDDKGYAVGSIGLAANRDNGNPGDIAYTNARLWTL